MKEQYVSIEVAKLLKEKGFCEENVYCYYQGEYENDSTDVWRGECKFNWNIYNDSYSAPTQQMACRWLREEHKIHITAEPLEMFKQERIVYEPIIYLLNDFDDFALEYKTVHLKECDTNEYAIEVALQYCLTNLI